jgi:large subunit ribosomal protein L9
MAVTVILRQHVPNLGDPGDVKQVAPGYFRNYLLPRGLAVEASKANLKNLQVNASHKEARLTKAKQQSSALAQQIDSTTITIPVRLGEQGRIYGSVTNKDIADALSSEASIEIDRHKIELREPLRSIGEHTVTIRLEHGEEAKLKVELVPAEAS